MSRAGPKQCFVAALMPERPFFQALKGGQGPRCRRSTEKREIRRGSAGGGWSRGVELDLVVDAGEVEVAGDRR